MLTRRVELGSRGAPITKWRLIQLTHPPPIETIKDYPKPEDADTSIIADDDYVADIVFKNVQPTEDTDEI